MKHSLRIVACMLLVSCAPASAPTPTPVVTMTSLPTALPIVATPPPGPALVLREYMQLVYERVLPEFAQRVATNRELLSVATSRSFDADMLCPEPETGPWQHFDDLALQVSVIVPPPFGFEFHEALAEALAAAQRSAESYDWFCTTYASFGQPAEGMWSRLSLQVRACEDRVAALRAEWAVMGGAQMGLLW